MSSTTKLQAEFIDLLLKTSRKIPVFFDAYVKRYGLTLARARTLIALKKQNRAYQKELADILDIENATMVRRIDALEKQGLVIREAVENDRRANNIILTEQGNAIVGELEQYSKDLRIELMADIDNKRLEEAIFVLRDLMLAMEQGR